MTNDINIEKQYIDIVHKTENTILLTKCDYKFLGAVELLINCLTLNK